MFHYVYRITHLKRIKHYYGCRSSKITPEQDLGKKYFSSSSDKKFIAEQHDNHKNFKYKIVGIFTNRKNALKLEIKLHEKFNVSSNHTFYNKANQTTSGFTTFGVIPSKLSRLKASARWKGIGNPNNNRNTKGVNNPMFGVHRFGADNPFYNQKHSSESLDKMKKAKKLWYSSNENPTTNTIWVNNGVHNKRIKRNDKIPPNYIKGQISKTCPHCKKQGLGGNMTRYHFDNCKN